MKFCDEKIQRHLLNGRKIIYSGIAYPLFLHGGTICFKNDIGEILGYSIREEDLTADDWRIVEPNYDWDKIIEDKILCVFYEVGFEPHIFGKLEYLINHPALKFKRVNGDVYSCCKPLNLVDFNIAKNIKEYEK